MDHAENWNRLTIADVAHRIKNPLTTIKMGLEAVAEDNLSPRNRERLLLCLSEVSRLDRSVNQALADATPPSRPLSLNALVKKSTECVLGTLRARSVRCHLDLAPNLPSLSGCEDELQDAISNIILNAAQASSPESTVTVATQRQGSWAIIQVRDSGPGIPQRHLHQVRDPVVHH